MVNKTKLIHKMHNDTTRSVRNVQHVDSRVIFFLVDLIEFTIVTTRKCKFFCNRSISDEILGKRKQDPCD